ncbi:hypothetical protein PHYBLDRAFT_73456 [Phycomyces blakesleeanus NRRL 1555(-)]|uniref:Retrotransposon gag domain-containing protein n=1 Tax=Phycomyces blakesleeanus (strain ATCC 8743b / DSM 1359 / FGSC 10004 / NBRC 33097 / NRRL 1555) TaxID=763407 RepID=A0A167RG17_PHYB8|nr:hypothetical protein PHYBLDRAFT_73456 [Phycomyces blakesleeanus NRRL 1555(-)]OAD81564.1 hypothetical protein PHYBLDRAFT_73456 [Phycomyces blakesleeanus NRRL 1555(-)]|eukprot:XP_018299604.1 hypothetical protein PHYBLDRAFT_73456 [Phycomyces blakesleeanus NRRL 1555(-)]
MSLPRKRTEASIKDMQEKVACLCNELAESSDTAPKDVKDVLNKAINTTKEDLAIMQNTDHEWDSKEKVYATAKECLDYFEVIIQSHSQNIDNNWHCLLPHVLSLEQRAWFHDNHCDSVNLPWSLVRNDLIGINSANNVECQVYHLQELMTLQMKETKSVSQYTDRFQRARRSTQIDDCLIIAIHYTNTLLSRLSRHVYLTQINLFTKKRDMIIYAAQIACSIYSIVIKRKDFHTILPRRHNSLHTRSHHASSSISSRRYRQESDSHRVIQQSHCPVHMSELTGRFHGTCNHDTANCCAAKDIIAEHQATAKVEQKTANSACHANPCCHCGQNWFYGHHCHSKFSDSSTTNKDKAPYMVWLWALVDTRATISSVNTNTCTKFGWKVLPHVSQIVLVTNNATAHRIEVTLSINVFYNSKSLVHSFEVLNLSEYVDISTGTDLMSQLGIYLLSLADS